MPPLKAHAYLRLVPLALMLSFATGADHCDSPDDGACTVGGVTYANGTNNIPAPDGCNTCACVDGELGCTEIGCPPSDGACVVDGVTYPDGTNNITAPDGCNTCACVDGALGCTEIGCSPPDGACVVGGVIYPDGTNNITAPDGCNTCECVDGALGCTEIGCTPPDGACVVDNMSYPNGTSGIPAPDGCNTCECVDGALGCTEIGCPPSDACSVYGVTYSEGWAPAPDGCNTCQCVDGVVTAACSRIGCRAQRIEPCTAWSEFPSDAFDLNAARVDGDTLALDVSYGGGCASHYFRLCYDRGFLESATVQMNVRLEHDGQGDTCEAYLSETRRFDLRPIADEYNDAYGEAHGTVILRIGDEPRYEF